MNDFCDEDADVEILSELFKNSKLEPRFADFVNDGDDPLDAPYQQAVDVAEKMEWAAPSRAEFEEQYRQEVEKLRRHE
jgi:hypothetical protein